MKRVKRLLCYGVLLALLGGCGDIEKPQDGVDGVQLPQQDISDKEPVQENVDETEKGDNKEEEKVSEVIYQAIPQTWQSMDEQGILWQVPNKVAEEQGLFDLVRVGTNGYICRPGNGVLRFVKMDFADGSILQETEIDLTDSWEIQVLKNGIVVYSSQTGKVIVFDTNLQVIAEFQTEATKGDWYFGEDGRILYDFHYEGTLSKVNLSTGKKDTLLEGMVNCQRIGQDEDYVNFKYMDSARESYKYFSLNLQTGQLDTQPFLHDISELRRDDNFWICQSALAEESYKIYNENLELSRIWSPEFKGSMDCKEISIIKEQRHILAVTEEGAKMILHDYEGKFISQCQMPLEYSVMFNENRENYLIWDDRYGGYFFMSTHTPDINVYQKIFFWDTHAQVSGSDMFLVPIE